MKDRTVRCRAALILFLMLALTVSVLPAAGLADTAAGNPAEVISAVREHTGNAEDEFSITLTADMAERLFKQDTNLLSGIFRNNGVSACSYTWTLEGSTRTASFSDLVYYSGQRIAAAYRSGDTSGLNGREKQTLDAAKIVAAGLSGSELDREKAIHDYLCDHVTYYTNSNQGLEEKDTAVGAILNGFADCDGFSDAFSMLCDIAGLENRRVRGACSTDGIDGPHMWNAVRIDGKWVFVDVTNDNQPSEQMIYTFFNKGADELRATHTWNAEELDVSIISQSDSSTRSADQQAGYVTSWTELADEVYRQALTKSSRILLTYPDSFQPTADPSQLSTILYKSGLTGASFAQGANSIEIINISYYDSFRKVFSEQEAADYLKECKKAGLSDFTLLCTDSLYDELMKNNGSGIFSLLNGAGYSVRTVSYNQTYGHIIITDAK